MIPKPSTARSEAYKSWIRSLPCLCCLKPSEPHHEPAEGQGGMGMKSSDYRCIPLCSYHHRERHQIGKHTFARKWGIDYEGIIARLQTIYERRNE